MTTNNGNPYPTALTNLRTIILPAALRELTRWGIRPPRCPSAGAPRNTGRGHQRIAVSFQSFWFTLSIRVDAYTRRTGASQIARTEALAAIERVVADFAEQERKR